MKSALEIILFTFFSIQVFAGGTTSGGGDPIALEFYASADIAVKNLSHMDKSLTSGINFTKLQTALSNVKIGVVETELNIPFDDFVQQSAAENIPAKNLILINRTRWAAMTDIFMRQALSLHEILSLIGLETTASYHISQVYYSSLENHEVPANSFVLESYSKDYYTVSNNNVPTIYAGSTSNNTTCTGAGCDSCAAMAGNITSLINSPTSGSGTVCSLKEIHPSDVFTFEISSTNTALPSMPAVVYLEAGGMGNAVALSSVTINGYTNPYFRGDKTKYMVSWSQVCQLLSGDSSCTTSFPPSALTIGWSSSGSQILTETVQVSFAFRYAAQSSGYASWNNPHSLPYEGYSYFNASPIDGGATIVPTIDTSNSYLTPKLESTTDFSFPDPSGITYSGIAIFYSSDSNEFSTANPRQVFRMTAGDPAILQGLTNGITYYLFMASVDQAGILTFFSNPIASPRVIVPRK